MRFINRIKSKHKAYIKRNNNNGDRESDHSRCCSELFLSQFMQLHFLDNSTNTQLIYLYRNSKGRDFHDFMSYWSLQPNVIVTCFTSTQIPGIGGRLFPPEMCNNDKNGNRYPNGLMIYDQNDLETLIEEHGATMCALAYSDISYDSVQNLAAKVNSKGASFIQLPPALTQLHSSKPLVSICATRTGTGKSQTTRAIADYLKKKVSRSSWAHLTRSYILSILIMRYYVLFSIGYRERRL